MADNSFSLPLLPGGNPVLGRELRVALRNERAFALMALYVAILGAIVASQFPDNMTITVEAAQQSSSQKGAELFWTFCWAQFVLVLVLLPGLAAGALAQERERQTLEPLLLSPLTPLQIVWGKAVGVLAFTGLLLLATVPLTSLCFLLGGVSPDMVVAAYVGLLGLAAFITAFGLYCSARWQSATQATVACYALLPFMLAVIAMFLGPGSIVAGVTVVFGAFYLVVNAWRRAASSPVARRLGIGYNVLLVVMLTVLFFAMLWGLSAAYRLNVMWVVLVGVFVVPYFLGVTYLGLGRAAAELARALDPRTPTPQRIADLKAEWERAVTPPPVVYLPSPTGRYTYTSQASTFTAQAPTFETPVQPSAGTSALAASAAQSSAVTTSTRPATGTPGTRTPAPGKADELQATYGVRPFLRDNLNPVFAKDLRVGLLGKFSYLFRFSYVVAIGTEIMVGLLLWMNPYAGAREVQGWFSSWGGFHLALLMIAGAVFGARSLAPEREQQTLQQLLTTPLLPSEIVRGKMMAVMVYTFYVFVMGLPLALLLPALGLAPALMALVFLFSELVYGGFAAALGLFCSLHGVTVRRALGWSLGGVLGLLMANMLLSNILGEYLRVANPDNFVRVATTISSAALLPFTMLDNIMSATAGAPLVPAGTTMPTLEGAALWALSILIYATATLFLLIKTGRDFKRYAQNV
ncbi:MAG TPA: ABC transporter permease subunit [Abditibacteriaceae bacterium]|jgi:ABC-type transport system involved in multi-copper enzyme maturation permease subunit